MVGTLRHWRSRVAGQTRLHFDLLLFNSKFQRTGAVQDEGLGTPVGRRTRRVDEDSGRTDIDDRFFPVPEKFRAAAALMTFQTMTWPGA